MHKNLGKELMAKELELAAVSDFSTIVVLLSSPK